MIDKIENRGIWIADADSNSDGALRRDVLELLEEARAENEKLRKALRISQSRTQLPIDIKSWYGRKIYVMHCYLCGNEYDQGEAYHKDDCPFKVLEHTDST